MIKEFFILIFGFAGLIIIYNVSNSFYEYMHPLIMDTMGENDLIDQGLFILDFVLAEFAKGRIEVIFGALLIFLRFKNYLYSKK